MSENPTGDGVLVLNLEPLVVATQRKLLGLGIVGIGLDCVTHVSLNNLLQFTDDPQSCYELPAVLEFGLTDPDHYDFLYSILDEYTTDLRGRIQRNGIHLDNVVGLHGWLGNSILLNVKQNF